MLNQVPRDPKALNVHLGKLGNAIAKLLFVLALTETVNIFANPIAGRGRGQAIAGRLQTRLSADGYAVRTSFDPPSGLDASILTPDARAAIVIGGDGTLRAVADRYLALHGRVPPLLPIPLGTANLMVRHLHTRFRLRRLESDISQAIARLNLRWLDAGRANTQLFLLMAGIGYDACVVHELKRIRRGPISMASYLVPAAIAFRDYNFPSLKVTVDGAELWSGPAMAYVGNVREYGTGFPVLSYAESNDGLLDVCIMPSRTRLELVHHFWRAMLGLHVKDASVTYTRGKSIHIESDRPAPVQLDGDAEGYTPLDLNLLPVRVPFIVA